MLSPTPTFASAEHGLDAEPDVAPEAMLGRAEPALCAVRLLDSAALLQGGKRVHIAHNGACYQLQTTRQGKLILTK